MPDISILSVLQVVVGLGLLNVWIVRRGSATSYRGGEATNLREEFEAYGLPAGAFYVVGALKIGAAIVLLAGLWIPLPVQAAAGVVALLMVGALGMHAKVGDHLAAARRRNRLRSPAPSGRTPRPHVGLLVDGPVRIPSAPRTTHVGLTPAPVDPADLLRVAARGL